MVRGKRLGGGGGGGEGRERGKWENVILNFSKLRFIAQMLW
jgi:hypothetical protein